MRLRRISPIIPLRCIKSLYHGLIQSRISYALSTYGGAARTHINKLQTVQNKIVTIISNREGESYFNSILNVDNLFAYCNLIKFFKIRQLGQHQNLFDVFEELNPTHSYSTRNSVNNALNVPLFRTDRCQQSFIYNAVHQWNRLPNEIKSCSSIKSFKMKCKTNLLALQQWF